MGRTTGSATGQATAQARAAATPRLLAVGLVGIAAILFALRTRSVLGDAINYCLEAQRGVALFHPQHLIYTAAIHWTHAALAAVGIAVDTITAAQAHNAVFAAALIGALALWLRRARGARSLGAVELGAPLFLLGTAAFLEFATQAESYVPALACTVGALAALADSAARVRAGRVLLAGLLLALGVMYHQMAVVLAPLLVVQALAVPGGARRPALREAGLAVLVAGALTLGAYLAVYLAEPPGTGFLAFCTNLMQLGHATWGTTRNVGTAGLSKLGASLAHAVVGPDRGGAGLVALGSLAWLLVANGIAVARAGASRALRLTCLAWASLLLAFLLWWLPSEPKYLVFALPPLAVLAALAIRDACGERTGRIVTVVLALGLLATGLLGQVMPRHRTSNPIRDRAAALHAFGDAGAVRICEWGTANYLWYDFQQAGVLPVSVPLTAAAKGRLWTQVARRSDPVRGAPTIVIPLRELRPETVAAYFAADSPDDPSRPWRDFASWLFELRGEGTGATRRAFSVRALGNGEPVVVLTGARVPCAGQDALLATLQAAIARESGGDVFGFTSWKRRVFVGTR